MKKLYFGFAGLAGLALAACEPSGMPAAPEATEPVAQTPVVAEPAPAAITEIPPQYLGKWDASAEDCGRASIMTLTVSANELLFHESIGEIETVTPDGANAITVAGPFEGEGEQWDGEMRLELAADGNTLTTTNGGTATTRVRCS